MKTIALVFIFSILYVTHLAAQSNKQSSDKKCDTWVDKVLEPASRARETTRSVHSDRSNGELDYSNRVLDVYDASRAARDCDSKSSGSSKDKYTNTPSSNNNGKTSASSGEKSDGKSSGSSKDKGTNTPSSNNNGKTSASSVEKSDGKSSSKSSGSSGSSGSSSWDRFNSRGR
ncbi:MAG: hypothetical protein IH598_00695 [Bacteroidales bacterium]|nr:hypothetical protein [Bacteroidales bacterium]